MVLPYKYRHEQFAKFCYDALHYIVDKAPNVSGALIFSADGINVASHSLHSEKNDEIFSTLGNSLFSMSSSLLTQIKYGLCSEIFFNTKNSSVYMCPIDNVDHSLYMLLIGEIHSEPRDFNIPAKHLSEKIKEHLKNI